MSLDNPHPKQNVPKRPCVCTLLFNAGDILEKKELRMIPVLTGGAAYEDVPEVIRMVTLTVADNPEYLNRLHQTIKGTTYVI